MNPIFLTTKLSGYGGVERFGRQVVRALADLAAERDGAVRAFSLMDPSAELQELGLPDHIQLRGYGGSRVRFALAAFWALIRYSGSVLIFHPHLGPIAMLAGLFQPGLAYGVHLHGIDAWHRLPFLRRIALQRADFLTASSSYTATTAEASNDLDPARMTVLYPALDQIWLDKISQTQSKNNPQTGSCQPTILTVARLSSADRKKGVDLVIEALPGLREDFPGLRYILVGQGDDLPRLKELAASLGVENSLDYRGGLNDEQLSECYLSCNLFIMPSSKEGLGIVFLEAMAHSRPVIACEVGGSREAVLPGESGLLVPPDDVDAVQRAVKSILGDPDLICSMGIQGRELLERKFSTARLKDRLSSLMV